MHNSSQPVIVDQIWNNFAIFKWTDDVKSAATLQIIVLLTKKTWGQVSNGGTFYSFHGKLLSKNIARTAKRHLNGGHLFCYLEYICIPEPPFLS